MEGMKQEIVEKKEEKKSSFGTKFMNFLSMGGIVVIVVGGLALFILISVLIGKK